MNAFAVDLVGLDTAVADAAAWQRTVAALAAQLDDDVDRLHAGWAGHSADAHLRAHDDWAADQTAIEEALAALREALARAGRHYRGAAATNVRMWTEVVA